jgi:predicted hotdog family 3-hydroxylacyl-ACP dehydratase
VTDDGNPSVLNGLQPFEWSNEQSVAYEVALELIHQAMACYTGLVDKERQGENRPERIQELMSARGRRDPGG